MTLEEKIDALSAQVADLAERQRQRDELVEEMTPILKEMVRVGADRLAVLEGKGYFAFGRELMNVVDAVVTGYSPQDVALLAQSVTGILDTVRALTQPHMLEVMADAGAAVEGADEVKPVGMMGMFRASGEEEVQRGMAVMLEVLRRVGRGAAKLDRRERMRQQLAPRDDRGGAPVRRAAATAAAPSPAAPAPADGQALSGIERVRAARAAREVGPSPAASAAASAAEPALPTIPGVELTPEGFMVDSGQWTPEIARAIAATLGVELTDAHLKLIEAARDDYAATGASPNVRRLTRVSGIGTKELYAMFPKSPGKCAAMISGLPKPAGCI